MTLKQPKYANVPGAILYNTKLPAAVRDTYAQLRGLAWGKSETPPFDMHELAGITGKSQATLYEHMRLLRHAGALLWRPASNSTLIVSFGEAATADSRNSELLNKSLNDPLSEPLRVTTLRSKRLINPDSENSELSEAGKALLKSYLRWLGYDPENATPADLGALNWLSEHYTVDQVKEVYDAKKREDFWQKRQITPRRLRIEVAEYHRQTASADEQRAYARAAQLKQRQARQ